jgi:biopolymer transport protein ExbB/TolQ
MMLKLNKSIGIVSLVLLALILAPTSGWSQGYGSQQQSEQSEVSVDEVVSYAKAQNQVVKVRQKYQTRYANAKDQAQQQKIVEEMNKEMVAAVQKEGLSVERYNEILTAAQNDPALQQRISEVTQKMQ